MANYFTIPIKEGDQNFGFKEYFLRCVTSETDTPFFLREIEPVDDYYLKHADREHDLIEKYRSMSTEECEAEAQAQYERFLESYHKRKIEYDKLSKHYNALLDEVERNIPDSSNKRIQSWKESFKSNLIQSRDFDCGTEPQMPILQTGEEWRQSHIDMCVQAEGNLRSSYEEKVQERELDKQSRQFFRDLYNRLNETN